MAPETGTIVTFAAPPVVEVVAGVSFDGVDPEVGPLLAAFWKEQLRGDFPSLEQQPPYSPPTEQFPSNGPTSSIAFEFGGAFPTPRLWARSKNGQDLLQLQPGYFACNWRKVQPTGEYDRWPQRRAAFDRWFSLLFDFLSTERSIKTNVLQCEVTYINHIRVGRTWASHADFDKVFAVNVGSVEGYPLEQASMQIELLLKQNDAQPYGRLHAKILPAFGRDGKTPLYVFELVARGAPTTDSPAGAVAFLDSGREAIVRAFSAMTTRQMHLEWGIQE